MTDYGVDDDVQREVDHILEKHYFDNPELTAAVVDELSRRYREESYATLPRFIPPALYELMRQEVYDVLARRAVRRDLKIAVTSDTPRHLSTVSTVDMAACTKWVPAFYYSPVLTRFMSRVFGEPVFITPYENERFMVLTESRAGDTHGWHWDDYAFSLIWLVSAPPANTGGAVEFIPNTIWDKSDPCIVDRYLRERKVERRNLVTDDVYILRGDTAMHRVAPLEHDVSRVVLNLAWADETDLSKNPSHETLDAMYS